MTLRSGDIVANTVEYVTKKRHVKMVPNLDSGIAQKKRMVEKIAWRFIKMLPNIELAPFHTVQLMVSK